MGYLQDIVPNKRIYRFFFNRLQIAKRSFHNVNVEQFIYPCSYLDKLRNITSIFFYAGITQIWIIFVRSRRNILKKEESAFIIGKIQSNA